jgi:hypothetical protein
MNLVENLESIDVIKLFEFKDRSKSANEKIVKISELINFLRLSNNKKKELLMEFIDDNCIVVKDSKISWQELGLILAEFELVEPTM